MISYLFFNAYSEFNNTKVERGIEKLELGFVDGPGKQYDSVQFFEDFISIFEPSSSSPLDVPVLRHHFKEITSETVARERYLTQKRCRLSN